MSFTEYNRTDNQRYAIVDNNGVIEESKDYEEILAKFRKPDFEWDGDLIFVQILGRTR